MPLRGGRIFGQHGRRTDRAAHKIAFAVGANPAQHALGAICAEGAFECANPGGLALRWQIAIATFTIWL